MCLESRKVECLSLAHAFETLWAYYVQSDGELFRAECKEAARDFLASLEEAAATAPELLDAESLALGDATDIAAILGELGNWANGSGRYPYGDAFKGRFMLFAFITGVKSLILREAGVTRWPQTIMTSEERAHSERVLRWKPHLPKRVLMHDPDALVAEASESRAIAVIADIRRSQDLMTYAKSADDFSERMVQFITHARSRIEELGGVFDKFTGDGYLAFFSEAVCTRLKQDYKSSFLAFVREQHDFASAHFSNWLGSVRKQPTLPTGLAIGADIGQVAFLDKDNHLMAVGDCIVWATRMAAAASAGETVVNNLLHRALTDREGLQFEAIEGTAKGGESFLGQRLSFGAA